MPWQPVQLEDSLTSCRLGTHDFPLWCKDRLLAYTDQRIVAKRGKATSRLPRILAFPWNLRCYIVGVSQVRKDPCDFLRLLRMMKDVQALNLPPMLYLPSSSPYK